MAHALSVRRACATLQLHPIVPAIGEGFKARNGAQPLSTFVAAGDFAVTTC